MLSKPSRGLVLLALGLSLGGCEPTNQGYAPSQPIVYSHAVHAGALEIPCQYCHYAADRGKYAGIPPAQTCMNCHEQVVPDHPEIQKVRAQLASGEPIAWVAVHRLPDHATFDHSAHVTHGVSCQSCHGDIAAMGRVRQEQPLSMGFCIDCHRTSGAKLAATAVGLGPPPLSDRANRLTDCVVCHH